MIVSEGNNNFENNTFSFWEWSAPILQTPEELVAALHDLRLQGRVIADIRAIGMGYNWREDDIGDAIYNRLVAAVGEEHAQEILAKTEYPEDVKICRWAELDEPLLIRFQDGDILGICFDEGGSARLSLNTIPWNIQPGINHPTFHANRLFADMLGKTITQIEVTSVLDMPVFTGSHGLTLGEQPAYISKLTLYYNDNGIIRPCRSLVFEPLDDYGIISLIDQDGCCCEMPCTESIYVTEGFDI